MILSLIDHFEIPPKAPPPQSPLFEKDHLPSDFYWSILKVAGAVSVPQVWGIDFIGFRNYPTGVPPETDVGKNDPTE